MDTKLKSNGPRPESTEPLPEKGQELAIFYEEMDERPGGKKGGNSAVLYLLGMMLCILLLFAFAQIRLYDNRAYENAGVSKMKRMLFASSSSARGAAEEVLRYEKNLQRFFIHYEGFNPENPQEITAASSEEIKQLQIEHELMYQQAVREITEKYSSRLDAMEQELRLKLGIDYNGITENLYNSRYMDGAADDTQAEARDAARTPDEQSIQLYDSYLNLISERDLAIKEAERIYILSEEAAAEVIEQNRQENSVYDASNYYDIKAYLENTAYLRYCLRNTQTDTYYTNIPVEEWVSNDNPVKYAEANFEYTIAIQDEYFSVLFNGEPLNEYFRKKGISGYIVVPEHYGEDNPIAVYMKEKSYTEEFFHGFKMALAGLCVLTAVVVIAFFKSDKKRFLRMITQLQRVYRRLPLLIKLCICGAIVYLFLNVREVRNIANIAYHNGIVSAVMPYLITAALGTAASLFLILLGLHGYAFVRKPSILFDEVEFGWLRQFFGGIALVYGQRLTALSVSMTFLLLLFCVGQVGIFFAAVYVHSIFAAHLSYVAMVAILEIALCVMALFVFGLIAALAKTNKYMDEIIGGNFEIEIADKSFYKATINKLNRLRGGVRRVVVEKNKSDKMKADLVTNVSHDLKTPLTSIINYIELLKTPNLTEEQRMGYIDVLDKKSQRVRFLIDDLFEATKLSSGQITLEKVPLNIVDMLQQAVGELEDRFQAAGITLKMSGASENITVLADGKKLWRVFENLFMNMIKYSQTGTRAYVDVDKDGKNAVVTFKNVSSYEMNFEYEELFERFRRGDVARTTEGSGLGLSIAKDIVELHGGAMEIHIDGDLFKVVVVLPQREDAERVQ